MSISFLLWTVASLVGLGASWLACAHVYRRKIKLLQRQHKADRQTALDRFNQARHQIGLLQADLASRPPGARRADPAPGTPSRAAEALIDRVSAHEDGFAKTMIGPQGFQATQLMT